MSFLHNLTEFAINNLKFTTWSECQVKADVIVIHVCWDWMTNVPCCVYYTGETSFEVKAEADSNDVTWWQAKAVCVYSVWQTIYREKKFEWS